MTNCEKYKTAQEREKAFDNFCDRNCSNCKLDETYGVKYCIFQWLDLEAEKDDKPLPCPFCGNDCAFDSKTTSFKCKNCNYASSGALMHESSIAAHNRIAKAVAENARLKDALEPIISLNLDGLSEYDDIDFSNLLTDVIRDSQQRYNANTKGK